MRALLLLAVIAALGCEDPPKKTDKKEDAGTEAPVMDPNIAKAVASAQVNPDGNAAAAATQGPPPNGVFPPGAADAAHQPGTPLVLTVVKHGSAPKVSLKPNLDLSKGGSLKVIVSRQTQGRAIPNTLFSLGVSTPAEGDGSITFTVKDVAPARDQPGALPQDINKLLATLKGTRVVAKLDASGAISGEKVELSKDAKPGLDQIAEGLTDVLGLCFSPMPDEPVGVGAYWIAHERTQFGGVNVVRYRVTKIEKLAGDELVLSTDVRMYAVDQSQMPKVITKQAAEQGLAMMAFETKGTGNWTVKTPNLLPTSGEIQLQVMAALADPNNPQRAAPVQFVAGGRIPAAEGKAPQ